MQTHIRLLLKEQSDLGPHFLSLYLTLLNNVSKNLQQTTNADRIFRLLFAGVLRVKNEEDNLIKSAKYLIIVQFLTEV